MFSLTPAGMSTLITDWIYRTGRAANCTSQ